MRVHNRTDNLRRQRLQDKARRLAADAITVLLCAGLLSGCQGASGEQEAEPERTAATYEEQMELWKEQASPDREITCWYTSEADRTWIEQCAENFKEQYGLSVSPVYYDGVSLFEDMNSAALKNAAPDVYLAGNDQMELAALSGMALPNAAVNDVFWKESYPETAVKAVTYRGQRYGYPVYFDTYCLVYDAKLLKQAPASMDEILDFLDEYEDTGSTKAIFRWDVADPYINTMFYAAYVDLFGENGDQADSFQVNNEKSVAAMEYFQSLSEYLWMNKKNISHDTVRSRIKDGTLVLGLCKSDILPTLYEMQAGTGAEGADVAGQKTGGASTGQEAEGTAGQETEGTAGQEAGETAGQDTEGTAGQETEGTAGQEAEGTDETAQEAEAARVEDETDYRVSYVPSLTADLASRTLSTTCAAMVNPYGQSTAGGEMFALYLSYACADGQFAGNGKLPVRAGETELDGMQSIIYAQYSNSQPVPKVMVLGDYMAESGIVFDAIWSGHDVKEQLAKLQSVMEEKLRIN